MATFVNTPKHTISPTGMRKAKVATWGDVIATWGDSIYAWGFGSESYINQDKSTLATFLELQDGTSFLLQDGGTLELQGGSGALVWTNTIKN